MRLSEEVEVWRTIIVESIRTLLIAARVPAVHCPNTAPDHQLQAVTRSASACDDRK